MPSIAVKDFGPIAHADVDLKPLTVLIGANNTGKSYLALAIHSLSQTAAAARDHRSGLPRPRRSSIQLADEASVQRLVKAGVGSDHVRSDMKKYVSGAYAVRDLPPAVIDWLRHESKRWATAFAEDMAYELQRCFGSSMSQLGRKSPDTEPNGFEIEVLDEATGLSWTGRCSDDRLSTVEWKPDMSNRSRPRTVQSDVAFYDAGDAAEQLMDSYLAFLLRDYSARSHYLPASRSDILQRYKTLASLVVRQASTAWIESNDVERLPGVVADLVQALLILDRARPSSGAIKNVAEFLESNVVAGSVEVNEQLEYPDIQYRNDAGEFRLHQVSSVVSEIAPMILYLKYLVRPGHLFVFEEPESHLHPANQCYVARAIAMLVNAGVRVLVTTHSDIFLNQINNLMQIFRLEAKRRDLHYGASEMLNPSDVSAYLFQSCDRGTQVDSLPIDADYGIPTASFDEVHRALYDEAVDMEHSG